MPFKVGQSASGTFCSPTRCLVGYVLLTFPGAGLSGGSQSSSTCITVVLVALKLGTLMGAISTDCTTLRAGTSEQDRTPRTEQPGTWRCWNRYGRISVLAHAR